MCTQINLNIHIVLVSLLLIIGSVGFGVKDLPIVMQAMFIIQLQIVPDKVLLSNRDTFMGSQKLGEKNK